MTHRALLLASVSHAAIAYWRLAVAIERPMSITACVTQTEWATTR